MSRAAAGLVLAALLLPTIALSQPAKTPGACAAKNLSLSLLVSRRPGAVVATAGLHHFRGRTCRLQTALTLRLLTKLQRGRLLRVSGNPARVKLDVTLRPRDRVRVAWGWRNWCGSHAPVAATVLTASGGGTGVKLKPPACGDKGKPSTLARTR